MKRIVLGLSSGFLLSVLACAMAWAQATAQMNGLVRDQTGAVLPGVEVIATHTDTGITRNTITDETGSYTLPNLPTGPYRLAVALPGFRTFVQTGIVLQVNSNPVINVVLEVGQVTEQVEVQANAAMLETRAMGVGQVIENERILELPLNGRQVTDLIVLAGAAVQTGVASRQSMHGGVAISVAGGLDFGVTYVLDGAMHNNPYDSFNLPMPFPDALQEFKVETSSLSAENGMHSGAAVKAVTKSGTNELHGNAFDFVRNDLFNARNYFARSNSTLKRNQFGGTLGGPIQQNKLFFFGGYQGTTLRQDPADIQSYVPTAAMMAGDFTAFASPACNAGRQITLRAPFVNNRVDPALYSKAAVNIINKLPSPPDQTCGLITYGRGNVENHHQAVGKIDYQWSDKQSLFGRYMATIVDIPNPFDLTADNILNVGSAGYDNLAQSFAFGDTYLIDSNTVNSFRLALNRAAVYRFHAEFFGPEAVGIPVYSYMKDYLQVAVTGGFTLGFGGASNSTFRSTGYQIGDDVNLVRGTHQMSFGFDLAHWRVNVNANRRSNPDMTFSGQDTGVGMGDFLLGKLSMMDQSSPNSMFMSQWYFGLHAQDAWRATSRLTLNYGLRWEPYFPPVLRNGAIYNFNYDRFQQGIKSTVFRNAPAGFYYPGDPGFPGKTGSYKKWLNLGPRVGLAWDPQGNGRTSIRASYGLAYDFHPGGFNLGTSANAPPWASRVQVPSPPGGLDNPWLTFPGGNPFPSPPVNQDSRFTPGGVFLVTDYNQDTPYSSSWNLSIQREIAASWLLSTSYMGTQTIHVRTAKPLNSAIYFPGGPCTFNGVTYNPCSTTANTDARRKFTLERPQDGQYIAFADEYDDGGTQTYHGLLVSVQRRAANGLTVGGNYTWSHCLGDPTLSQANAGANAYQNPSNRDADRGNCDSDRRHLFNLTAVAETPQLAKPTLRALATGWRLSGIYRRSSGNYLTLTTGVDRALSGTMNQRPNQVLQNPYGDKSARPLTNYLNLAAFAQPALGTLGNMGRGNIEGVGTWQFDVALSRTFRFRETQRLEFRAEAYNITNSFRPQNPVTGLNQVNTFGQIRTALEPRIMQFALKYVF